jgi:hypothetical protein
MGSTADPRRCAQPDVLRAGGVLAQARRGAQGRSGRAAGRLPGCVGCHAQYGPRPWLYAGCQSAGSDRVHFYLDLSPSRPPRIRCPCPAISQYQPRISTS